MNLADFEKQLQEATLDPKKAMEIAGELAINWLGKLHERADTLRVEVNKAKVNLKDTAENLKMSMAEVKMRIEATDLFLDYLKAEHAVERCEEIIMIAKRHAALASGF